MQRSLNVLLLLVMVTSLLFVSPAAAATDHEACRPDGLYRAPGVNTPYCLVYDTNGREKMGSDHPRRIIGYFTSWRHGKNGFPAYLASDIPWDKLTHINYAFAWVDSNNRISIGDVNDPNNPATGLTWPGVAGAEMDPSFSYNGHFNLLNKYKKQYPDVKTLISVGGWADSRGFYTMTVNDNNTINTAGINTFADSAVAFLRAYGFDGLDIDYEYPTSMKDAGNPLDFSISNARRATLMKAYEVLMKTLREKLDAASAQDGKYYLLTVAAPSSGYLLRGMEYFQVSNYLDYINVMSYDLHGAWNEFVGPNAALYDDGQDVELIRWNYYTSSQYGQLGYLNTDWSFHYFRGAVPAGRINIGVPYYTRGFRDVVGGANGLWGKAVQPDVSQCAIGLTACGKGAIGIDNVWHDVEHDQEVPAGSNPMWHAKNLENGILPDYLEAYGLTPETDPTDQLIGTYTRYYNSTLVAPWLWNDQKKVFISTEDEESLNVKAQYIIDRGIGGVMFWELAGDYEWNAARNEYYMGDTLTTLLYNKFKTASPYGNLIAKRAMPSQELNVNIQLYGFALGDSNYPINPKMKITNNSTVTIPGGAEFQFNYSSAAPGTMTDQSGFGLKVIQSEHTGNNIGGIKGDYHLASFKLPTWQSLAPGASVDITLNYYLPIPKPYNFTITFDGQSYRISTEYARGGGGSVTVTPTTVTPTTVTPTTVTPTTVTPTKTFTPTPTAIDSNGVSCAGVPQYSAGTQYTTGQNAQNQGKKYRCDVGGWCSSAAGWAYAPGTGLYWSQAWTLLGVCNSGPTPTTPVATNTFTPSPTITPTSIVTKTFTPSPTPTTPVVTKTFTPSPTITSTSIVTKTFTPSPTITPTSGIPAWKPNTAYTAGQLVTYGGKIYKCLQPHTSLTGWEPPNVPALWQAQ